MHSITGSVGEGGMNHKVDTALIQTLLAVLPNDAGGAALAIDGVVGPSTKQAIRNFQRTQLLMEDGLVQPNDFTIKRLTALIYRLVADVTPIDAKENAMIGSKLYTYALVDDQDMRTLMGEKVGDQPASDGIGTVRIFQHMKIFYHPELGAYETHGEIATQYWNMGGEASALGYPISDERSIANGGRASYFQYGTITWTSADGVVVHPSPGI